MQGHPASRKWGTNRRLSLESHIDFCAAVLVYAFSYVVKNNGQKLTVIPLTSIKEDSGPAKESFEMDIDEGNGKKGRMHFDEMRSIDKMRVIEKKGYREVFTPREKIEAGLKHYLSL